MKASIRQIENGLVKFQKRMARSDATSVSFLRREIFPLYQQKQEKRWITQGASEGAKWSPLSRTTLESKTRDRRLMPDHFPGGEKILVHRGWLFNAVTGRDLTFHRRLITPGRMYLAVTLPYAGFVDEKRSFTSWGQETRRDIRERVVKYLRRLATG